MGNETEKDVRNQQSNPAGATDPSKKNPMHQGGQNPNQQDPYKKNSSQVDNSRQHEEEESDQAPKRRAS